MIRRHLTVVAGQAVGLVAAATLVACANTTPVALSNGYLERGSHVPAASSAACTVLVEQITDNRSDPTVLGVVLGRAVKSPPDAKAWLRNVLQGLNSRGVAVAFEGDANIPANAAVRLAVELRIAWLTNTSSNKTANIVLHVRGSDSDGHAIDDSLRGSRSTIDWSASDDELKKLIDEAFAVALDQLAQKVKSDCSHGPEKAAT